MKVVAVASLIQLRIVDCGNLEARGCCASEMVFGSSPSLVLAVPRWCVWYSKKRGAWGCPPLPSGSRAALGPVSSVASLLEPLQLHAWGSLSSAVQQQFTEILAVENKDLGTSVCVVSSD